MNPDGPIDIYARQSRADDERQRSPEGQVADCRAALAERGLQVGQVHVDPGLSAWNPRVERPGWNDLMERLESGAAAGMITFDLERFSRQPDDGSRLIKAADRGLLVLDSDAEYDLMSPSGRKAFRDQLSAAEYYSFRLSKRVTRGKRLKAMKGEPNGSVRPFGFEPDQVTVRESEAAIIREVTRRLLSGEPQDSLVAELNARGIAGTRGRPWSAQTLKLLLTRQRNAGRLVYKSAVVGQLPGDPIVSGDELEAVIALYAARRRGRPNSPQYLCSGIAVCGKCGTPLSGKPRTNMKPYPDGSVRRQYWCQHGCRGTAIDQRGLDQLAGALTVEILSDPRHAAAIEAAAREARTATARLDQAIAEADELGDDLAAKLGRGEMSRRRYDAAAGPLEQRLARLKAERASISRPAEPPPAVESRERWQQRWDGATPGQRRALLATALRGRRLVVRPADARTAGGQFAFDASRVEIEER